MARNKRNSVVSLYFSHLNILIIETASNISSTRYAEIFAGPIETVSLANNVMVTKCIVSSSYSDKREAAIS
jgi:hypothetical protein